jgi:hypothetical protein
MKQYLGGYAGLSALAILSLPFAVWYEAFYLHNSDFCKQF